MGCADFEKTPMRAGDFVNERSIFEIGRFEDMAAEAAMPVVSFCVDDAEGRVTYLII